MLHLQKQLFKGPYDETERLQSHWLRGKAGREPVGQYRCQRMIQALEPGLAFLALVVGPALAQTSLWLFELRSPTSR